jgi:WD40 repeat protein
VIVLHKKGEREQIELLRFAPDGKSLLTASYSATFLWTDLLDPGARRVLPEVRYLARAIFTPDGRYLLTNYNSLTLIDLDTGAMREGELWNPWQGFFDLAPDGRSVLVAQGNRDGTGWLACWPLHDLTPKGAVWSRTLSRFGYNVTCVAGDRFVFNESWWDQQLRRSTFRYVCCSVKTGEVLTAVEGPAIGGTSPATSADGRLVAGLINTRVIVLSADDFSKPVATLRNDNRKHFTGIAFHPSGRYLAVTSNDATVKLYDTATWEVARAFTWDIGRMRSICFSPDGTLAAAGSDTGKVVVWDVDL